MFAGIGRGLLGDPKEVGGLRSGEGTIAGGIVIGARALHLGGDLRGQLLERHRQVVGAPPKGVGGMEGRQVARSDRGMLDLCGGEVTKESPRCFRRHLGDLCNRCNTITGNSMYARSAHPFNVCAGSVAHSFAGDFWT